MAFLRVMGAILLGLLVVWLLYVAAGFWLDLTRSSVFGAEPIRVEIGKDKEIIVTVPAITREDLIAVLSTFLSKGINKPEFEKILAESPNLTLILTTQSKDRKS